MTTIRQEDFIQSVADAFQFISFYHPAGHIGDPTADPKVGRCVTTCIVGRHGPPPPVRACDIHATQGT